MSATVTKHSIQSRFNQPTDFYRVRTFGEKWEAAVQFAHQFWRPLLIALVVYELPILLISNGASMWASHTYLKVYYSPAKNRHLYEDTLVAVWVQYLSYIVLIIASLIGTALVFGLYRLRLTFGDTQPVTRRTIWRETRGSLGSYFLLSIGTGLLSVAGVALLVLPGIYLITAFSLLPAIIFIERGKISRAFTLLKGHWWSTFYVALVPLVQTLFFYITPRILIIALVRHDKIPSGPYWDPLIRTLLCGVSLSITPVTTMLLAFHYFSIVEAKESPGLEMRAAQLGEMPAPVAPTSDYLYSPDDQPHQL